MSGSARLQDACPLPITRKNMASRVTHGGSICSRLVCDHQSLLFVSVDPSCVFSIVTACQANRQADSAITGPGGIELVQLNAAVEVAVV